MCYMMGQTRKTPLHVAASKDLKDIASLLISKGADIDCIDKVCIYKYINYYIIYY